MKVFTGKNYLKKLLFVLGLAIIFLVSVFLIKETEIATQIEDWRPAAETKLDQAKGILKELAIIKSSSTVDWSKKIDILLDVPFVAQAPLAEWSDPRQQDACEEASVLMAMAWIKGETLNPKTAVKSITDMADWQTEKYGGFVDTNAQDTTDRLIKGYFNYKKVEVVEFKNTEQIVAALSAGQLVLLPTNGQKLKNPNYKQPGPLTHMIVIQGYDKNLDEFITNDPGTRKGEKYRYPASRVFEAAFDYPTGDHVLDEPATKALIIISK